MRSRNAVFAAIAAIAAITMLCVLYAYSDTLSLFVTRQLRTCTPPCSFRPSGLTVGAVVDVYGPPDRIAAYTVNLGETYLFAVTLFYVTKGMTVDASSNRTTR